MAVVASMVMFSAADAEANSPTAQDMERFEEHVSQAARAMDEQDYQTGVEQLTRAAEIVDHPRLQLQLGEAYVGLDDCEQAQKTYDALEARDDIDDSMRERIDDRRARLGDCPVVGELLLECEPRDLTVSVDGEYWDCDQWMELEPDVYRATASRDGYDSAPVVIEVARGDRIEESVTLMAQSSSGDTLTYAGYGGLGVGGLLLGLGIVQDTRASGRAGRLIEAREAGDEARMAELRSDAESARTRTALSYGFGVAALAVGGGLVWYSSTQDDEGYGVDVAIGPRGVNALLRW